MCSPSLGDYVSVFRRRDSPRGADRLEKRTNKATGWTHTLGAHMQWTRHQERVVVGVCFCVLPRNHKYISQYKQQPVFCAAETSPYTFIGELWCVYEMHHVIFRKKGVLSLLHCQGWGVCSSNNFCHLAVWRERSESRSTCVGGTLAFVVRSFKIIIWRVLRPTKMESFIQKNNSQCTSNHNMFKKRNPGKNINNFCWTKANCNRCVTGHFLP